MRQRLGLFLIAAAGLAQEGVLPRTTIRTETRVVLVDAVVKDRNGRFVRDLTARDFRVWEDGKEQNLTSFSLEKGSPDPEEKRYIVLLFDTIPAADQLAIRPAVARFVREYATSDRYMAVLNRSLVVQNFTRVSQPLERAAGALAEPRIEGRVSLAGVLISVAESLRAIRGRKAILLFTETEQFGNPRPDLRPFETEDPIRALQAANVILYAFDVRGTAGMRTIEDPDRDRGTVRGRLPFLPAAFQARGREAPPPSTQTTPPAQTPTSTPPASTAPGSTAPANDSPIFVVTPPPDPPPPAPAIHIVSEQATDRSNLKIAAEATGGRLITNRLELAEELGAIVQELDEYYVLGYAPPEGPDGRCHALRVRVNRGGTSLRARQGYCSVKPLDLLAGKETGKALEARAAGAASGNMTAAMALPFFYTSANLVRVHVAMEIATAKLQFEKVKGKRHAELSFLGVAINAAGEVAARFSDTVTFDLETDRDVETFRKTPFEYANRFALAAGRYTMRVAFRSGESFGKVEMPLVVDGWDGQRTAISAIALTRAPRQASDLLAGLDDVVLGDERPLAAKSIEVRPMGDSRCRRELPCFGYFEVYGAQAGATLWVRVLESGTGRAVEAAELRLSDWARPGSLVTPVVVSVPVKSLAVGRYALEVRSGDARRVAELAVE